MWLTKRSPQAGLRTLGRARARPAAVLAPDRRAGGQPTAMGREIIFVQAALFSSGVIHTYKVERIAGK